MDRAVIPGSAPDHTGYHRESAVDPDTPVRATIVLRPPDSGVAAELLSGKYAPHASTGVDQQAMEAVENFARTNELQVEESDAAGRRIVVSGPPSRMAAAFGVRFGQFASPDGESHLSYDGEISVPSDVAKYVLAVLGLNTRPVARPRG
jgi:hypothetical protein